MRRAKVMGIAALQKKYVAKGFFDVRKTRQVNDFFAAVLSEMDFFARLSCCCVS